MRGITSRNILITRAYPRILESSGIRTSLHIRQRLANSAKAAAASAPRCVRIYCSWESRVSALYRSSGPSIAGNPSSQPALLLLHYVISRYIVAQGIYSFEKKVATIAVSSLVSAVRSTWACRALLTVEYQPYSGPCRQIHPHRVNRRYGTLARFQIWPVPGLPV